MLADAERDAQIIRAKGAALAAAELKDNPAAMSLYAQETSVRTAQALGGKSNVIIGMDNTNKVRFSERSFAAFGGGRQRSLSEDNIQLLGQSTKNSLTSFSSTR